jgi:hypothetical protein
VRPAAGALPARIRDSFHFDGLDGLRERSPALRASAHRDHQDRSIVISEIGPS